MIERNVGKSVRILYNEIMSSKKTGKIWSILTGVLLVVVIGIAIAAVVKFDATGREKTQLPGDYLYSIENLGSIDPGLIVYQSEGREIDTGFEDSRAIAVDEAGLIYVAGGRGVHVFSQFGEMVKRIDFDETPTALCIHEGVLYLGMDNFVRVYRLEDESWADWERENERAFFTSIAVDKENVFVADAGNRVVLRYDRRGEILNRIGEKDAERNIPGFVIPSPFFDLATAQDGLLRVVNPGRHRIEAYTYDGSFEFSWGKYSPEVAGFCGCCNPANMAILDDGRFVTAEKGLTRVKLYTIDGEFEAVAAGPGQLLKNADSYRISEFPQDAKKTLFDLAVLGENIFVLDIAENRILTFVPK